MNKNIAYVLIALVVIGAVGWVTYTQLAGSTEEKSAKQEKTSSLDTEKSDLAQKDLEPQTPESVPQAGPCQRNFNDSTLKTMTATSADKFVTLSIAGFGDIKVELNYTDAPLSSQNFAKLAKSGFYDCLTFHRIVPGFVVQGGDPDGTGAGGPGYTIPAEIKLKHTRGTIAMARQGDDSNPKRDSSGSQFYISLEDLAQLDGAYTVFGNVVAGMDVVDKISQVQLAGSTPISPVIINKATVSSN